MKIEEGTDLSTKIMKGVDKAAKKLFAESAARNEKLVVAEAEGNVMQVDAKVLLARVLEKEQQETKADS